MLICKYKKIIQKNMRTPQRKPGKFIGMIIDTDITLKKYKEMEEDLKNLKNIQKKATKEVAVLATMGDFSDNEAYSLAKGKLRYINQKIINTEKFLRKAKIIIPQKNKNIIMLGSKVSLIINGKRKEYQILGSKETNPEKGIISQNSPLGKKIIGKKINDKIKLKINENEIECEIIKIK